MYTARRKKILINVLIILIGLVGGGGSSYLLLAKDIRWPSLLVWLSFGGLYLYTCYWGYTNPYECGSCARDAYISRPDLYD